MRSLTLLLFVLLAACGGERGSSKSPNTNNAPTNNVAVNNSSNNATPTNNATQTNNSGPTNNATTPTNNQTSTNNETSTTNNGTQSVLFAPAEAAPDTWVWLEPEGVFCRDGSPTGMGVRLRPNSPNLLIFMMGGGACFSRITCNVNSESFGREQFEAMTVLDTAFMLADPASPISDWNQVFIPYCTGDLHGGTRVGDVPNCPFCPQNQMFVGHQNMTVYLTELAGYFGSTGDLVLAGSSAGGFGATLNYEQAVTIFGREPVLVNDSGPFMQADNVFSPCFNDHMIGSWGLDAIIPAGCVDCTIPGQELQAIMPYVAQTYSAPMAYLGAERDLVIRLFAEDGANRCNEPNVTPAIFQAGTYDLVDNVLVPNGWGSFVIDNASHVHLNSNDTVAGVDLATYLTDLIAGNVANLDNR